MDNIFKQSLNNLKLSLEKQERLRLPDSLINYYKKLFVDIALILEPNFKVEPINKKMYSNISNYFMGIPFENEFIETIEGTNEKIINTWSLSKGLLIMGQSGVGKDFTLDVFRKTNRQFEKEGYLKNDFKRAMCKDIPKNYSIDGAKIFKQYEKDIWYFSDLGEEDRKSANYSNSIEVMREIITSRYELWIKHKIPTHFSTNYNSTMLYQKYGERVFYRMNEMLNFGLMEGKNKRVL